VVVGASPIAKKTDDADVAGEKALDLSLVTPSSKIANNLN